MVSDSGTVTSSMTVDSNDYDSSYRWNWNTWFLFSFQSHLDQNSTSACRKPPPLWMQKNRYFSPVCPKIAHKTLVILISNTWLQVIITNLLPFRLHWPTCDVFVRVFQQEPGWRRPRMSLGWIQWKSLLKMPWRAHIFNYFLPTRKIIHWLRNTLNLTRTISKVPTWLFCVMESSISKNYFF